MQSNNKKGLLMGGRVVVKGYKVMTGKCLPNHTHLPAIRYICLFERVGHNLGHIYVNDAKYFLI